MWEPNDAGNHEFSDGPSSEFVWFLSIIIESPRVWAMQIEYRLSQRLCKKGKGKITSVCWCYWQWQGCVSPTVQCNLGKKVGANGKAIVYGENN